MPTGRPDWYNQVLVVNPEITVEVNNFPSEYPIPSSQISDLQQITITGIAAGIVIPVNIENTSITVNVENFPSEYPLPSSQVSDLQQITIQNIVAGLVIPISIEEANATVNIQGDVNSTIAGIVAGVVIPISIDSVKDGVVFDIHIASVESGVTFNVNITNTSLTVVIDTSGGPVDVNIKSQTATLEVNIGTFPFEKASENILENPGFETGDLSGWSWSNGTAQIESSVVKFGNYSAKLVPNSGVYMSFYTSNAYLCQPGQQIMFTGWIRKESGITVLRINVWYYSAEGGYVRGDYKDISDIDNDTWTDFKAVFTVPDGVASFRLGFSAYSTDGSSAVYVDSLHVPRMVLVGHSTEIPVNMNIASQSVDIDVNIKAQEVTLNVKVEGTASVSIDNATVYLNIKQESFTETRRTLENHGDTASYTNTVLCRGKFFPHGARGYISKIYVRCKNTDTADHQFTVYVSVAPKEAPLITKTVTVTAGFDDWLGIEIDRFWNYDGIFIAVLNDDASLQVAYDIGTPYDAWGGSTDYYQLIPANLRYWIKVNVYGQTTGDIPVSGTVNTINIPNITTDLGNIDVTLIDPSSSAVLVDFEGIGFVEGMILDFENVSPLSIWVYITVDGEQIFARTVKEIGDLLNNVTGGYQAPIVLIKYDTSNNIFVIAFNHKFEFKRNFKLEVKNFDLSTTLRVRYYTPIHALK